MKPSERDAAVLLDCASRFVVLAEIYPVEALEIVREDLQRDLDRARRDDEEITAEILLSMRRYIERLISDNHSTEAS
jgi:hypothetical protein